MGRRVTTGGVYKPTVPIRRESKDELARWLERNNNPEMGLVVGKVVDWFVREPATVQHVVLGIVADEDLSEAYATLLRRLADSLQEKRAVEDMAPPAPTDEVTLGLVNQGQTEVRKMRAGSGSTAPSPRQRSMAPADS